MFYTSRVRGVCVVAVLILAVASTGYADTIVRFKTMLGDFNVQLYDTDAPGTVANFLSYVNSGRYKDSFFHRLVPDFVLQGGGFTSSSPVDTFGSITNEFDPSRSNLRGTLAMAKLGGDPNSATSQFFINLGDNSGNLDNQNGGFTVFGEVMGNGMAVVDDLAAVRTFDIDGPENSLFNELPLVNHNAGESVGVDNLEIFNIAARLIGDVDGDGFIGGYDLVPVMVNWGETGMTLEQGEVSGDGFVGGEDLTTILTSWSELGPERIMGPLPDGGTSGTDDYTDVLTDWASNPPQPNPEPAALFLISAAGLPLLLRRRQRRS